MQLTQSCEQCAVCGGRSTGNHYGAVSCDGCKGFFKRTIEQGIASLYECRNGSLCMVDVITRNKCRACRFRRCLRAGMRVPGQKGNRQIKQAPEEAYDAFLDSKAVQLGEPACPQDETCTFVFTVQDAAAALSITRGHFFAGVTQTPLPLTIEAGDMEKLANESFSHRLVLDILCRSRGMAYFDLGNRSLYGFQQQAYPSDSLAPLFAALYPTMLRVNKLGVTDREFAYLRTLSFLDPRALELRDKESVELMRRHLMDKLQKEECDAQPQGGRQRYTLLIMLLRSTSVLAMKFHLFFSDNGAKELFAKWAIQEPGLRNETGVTNPPLVRVANGPMTEGAPMGEIYESAWPMDASHEPYYSGTGPHHWSS